MRSHDETKHTTMQQAIERTRRAHPTLEHGFFEALERGELGRDGFVAAQIQFLPAVAYFSRPMMALAARLSDAELRRPLVENAWEEHGEEDLSLAHEQTFQVLLERLGVEVGALDREAAWPGVRAFNASLMGVCAHEPAPTAMAALGMIEDLFAGMSGQLGRAILSRGWLGPDELIHYGLHEELDVEHAEAFYAPLRARWEADDQARAQIERGLELGAHMLWWLFDELYAAAQAEVGPRSAPRLAG